MINVVFFVLTLAPGKYDADFENGWGIWKSASNEGLIPWKQHSSFTQTMNTGPRGDHTLQGRGKV